MNLFIALHVIASNPSLTAAAPTVLVALSLPDFVVPFAQG
jgi:hypothetical protein